MLDPISPVNQEFKSRVGPSAGHSLLVEGLENLLSTRRQEHGMVDPDSDGDSDDGASSNWSRTGKYNILPLVPVNSLLRDGVSKSLPVLSAPAHFCSEKSGQHSEKPGQSIFRV